MSSHTRTLDNTSPKVQFGEKKLKCCTFSKENMGNGKNKLRKKGGLKGGGMG